MSTRSRCRTGRLNLLSLALLLVLGCNQTPAPASGGNGQGGTEAPAVQPAPEGPAAPHERTEPTADKGDPEVLAHAWLSRMTLEEKAGQLLLVGMPRPELSPEDLRLMQQGRLGGIILFSRNIRSAGQTQELIRQAQAEATAAANGPRPGDGVPLLIATDQEGGLVARLRGDVTEWPGNMALGAAGSEELAYRVGLAMGRELREVGVNVNLAPVVDVNDNPDNPVIGIRSFGEDPEQVARLGQAYIRGMQEADVMAVAKHFPGHGNTELDSHLALPRVAHGRDRLEQVELLPFRAAVAAGVEGVMSAHVVVPALDAEERPATLSEPILTGLLRDEMGYDGLLFSDAIDVMKAITDHWPKEKALVEAVRAGIDVLCYAESFGEHEALLNLLVRAVQNGELPQQRLEEAARRVLVAKARLGLLSDTPERPGAPPDDDGGRLAAEVARAAVTVVRNNGPVLPLDRGQKALLLTPSLVARSFVEEATSARSTLGVHLRRELDHVWELELSAHPTPEERNQVLELAAAADVVLFGVAGGVHPALAALFRDLEANGHRLVVLALREPYDLRHLPSAPAMVASYGWFPPNAAALTEVLMGRQDPRGRLPVTVPGVARRGAGIQGWQPGS